MNMFTSWKTTTTGLTLMVVAVFALKKTLLPAWNAGDATLILPGMTALLAGIGAIFARDHDVTSEQAGLKPDNLLSAAIPKIVGLLALGFCLLAIEGCAPLKPGADPLLVRTEQAETGAVGTFDLVLKTDDADREFWKAKAPEFHKFAEFLRAPVTIDGTNTEQRALAVVRSLHTVKLDYKAGRASSNSMVAALVTLQGVVSESAQHLGSVTNLVGTAK